MIATRKEFKNWICALFPDHPAMANKESAVWIPEESGKVKCQWFVAVPPVHAGHSSNFRQGYWDWCNQHLKGHVRCFMRNPDNNEEWWGFTDRNDIVLWVLKWSA